MSVEHVAQSTKLSKRLKLTRQAHLISRFRSQVNSGSGSFKFKIQNLNSPRDFANFHYQGTKHLCKIYQL